MVEALEDADDADEDELERAKEFAAEIEEVADAWREINSSIRNWWTGLLGNFDGGPSTMGSLTGPSDDQRRRLARLTDAGARCQRRPGRAGRECDRGNRAVKGEAELEAYDGLLLMSQRSSGRPGP